MANGNLESDVLEVTECWNAELETTYLRGLAQKGQDDIGASESDGCPSFDDLESSPMGGGD